MANPDHLALLQQGVDTWNRWRGEHPDEDPDLSRANLVGANLSGANLFGARLNGSDLSRANLSGANLSVANLYGANLTGARLNGARLSGAKFQEAKLFGANLTGANLRDAKLSGAKFQEAKLFGANLTGANLTGANLFLADLSDADLRHTRGIKLDSTFVRNARFSPDAADPWSTLRRNYTGPRLLFHLLLLIAFLAPYVVRTTWLVGLNGVQSAMHSFAERLQPIAEELKSDGHRSSAALGQIVGEIARVQPCLRPTCNETVIWKVLLGIDRIGVDANGWVNVLLAVSLLIYNICRSVLTWRVGPLREEEERSGSSPAFAGPDGYRWLIQFHRVVQILLFVAAVSFGIHAWNWLTMRVWVPA